MSSVTNHWPLWSCGCAFRLMKTKNVKIIIKTKIVKCKDTTTIIDDPSVDKQFQPGVSTCSIVGLSKHPCL